MRPETTRARPITPTCAHPDACRGDHDTYQAGCRGDACKDARTEYRRAERRAAQARWPDPVCRGCGRTVLTLWDGECVGCRRRRRAGDARTRGVRTFKGHAGRETAKAARQGRAVQPRSRG